MTMVDTSPSAVTLLLMLAFATPVLADDTIGGYKIWEIALLASIGALALCLFGLALYLYFRNRRTVADPKTSVVVSIDKPATLRTVTTTPVATTPDATATSATNAGGSNVGRAAILAAPYAGTPTPDSTNTRRFPSAWVNPPPPPDKNSDTSKWVTLDIPWAAESFGKAPKAWKEWVDRNLKLDKSRLPPNQKKPFPTAWGMPPADHRVGTTLWPHGFGSGGPETAAWISNKMKLARVSL